MSCFVPRLTRAAKEGAVTSPNDFVTSPNDPEGAPKAKDAEGSGIPKSGAEVEEVDPKTGPNEADEV